MCLLNSSHKCSGTIVPPFQIRSPIQEQAGTLYELKQVCSFISSTRLQNMDFQYVTNSTLDIEGGKGEKKPKMLKTQKEFWLMKVYLS